MKLPYEKGKKVSLFTNILPSVQFSSVVSDSLWPHESQHTRPPCPSPTPGVYSTHVHWVGDAIQPSHPLSSPSPPAPNPSQHQGLFQWVNSSHEMAKVTSYLSMPHLSQLTNQCWPTTINYSSYFIHSSLIFTKFPFSVWGPIWTPHYI